METILIVDDQPAICYSLKKLLESKGFIVFTALTGRKAIEILKQQKIDVTIIDLKMPDMDGLELLKTIKKENINVYSIMMTAFTTTDKAIEAIRLGAYDYLTKPIDNDELIRIINDIIKVKNFTMSTVSFGNLPSATDEDKIIGDSPKMLEIYKTIGRIAPTDVTVLIRGESGTGKELIAKAIYHYSKRSTMPFLAVNCAAIPESLLESELFGYERGAFTGAEIRKIGKLERCHRGTLFLDEIADMPLGIQAKILRALQDGSFERLGGQESIKSDIRLIAATNKDIEELVKLGKFREDLYYRLNVVTINIPPLRERQSDIASLVSYFITKFCAKYNKEIKGITSDALSKLIKHRWSGNVRELQNVVQKAIVFCRDNYITQECFNFESEQRETYTCIETDVELLVSKLFQSNKQINLQEVIKLIENEIIKRTLMITEGNQVQAAKMLGIARNTLRSRIDMLHSTNRTDEK